MTTSKVSTLPTYSRFAPRQQDHHSSRCTLKWRQGQLLVSLEQQGEQPHLPSLESKQWLVNCLKHSPVRLIRIDPALGEASLKFWADACEQAGKAVFLRLPAPFNRQRRPRSLWWLQRLINLIAAALLLVLLSPVMLGLVCLTRVQSKEPIFLRYWCVGERGRLFRLFKFRTMVVNTQKQEPEVINNQISLPKDEDRLYITPLGRWMQKSSLDQLPQLFNVLRGEMSLLGPRPWTLYDAVRLSIKK